MTISLEYLKTKIYSVSHQLPKIGKYSTVINYSRLAESKKNQYTKINRWENLLDVFHHCTFSFGTINTRSDLFVNYIWIAEIFQVKFA